MYVQDCGRFDRSWPCLCQVSYHETNGDSSGKVWSNCCM